MYSQERGAAMKLTEATVKKATLPAGLNKRGRPYSEVVYFDDDMAGFGLRIRNGGHKSYIFQYEFNGSKKWNCGAVGKITLAKAKDIARDVYENVRRGVDPATKRQAAIEESANTLEKTAADFLAHKQQGNRIKQRSLAEFKRYLETYWKPLHRFHVGHITPDMIAAEFETLTKERGSIAANRALTSLSSLFVWAIKRGRGVTQNPCAAVEPNQEKARERVLTDGELAQIWLAAPDNDYGKILRLLMLTACRRDEIGSAMHSELDKENHTFTISSDRTKNGNAHTIPLPDAAMQIFEETGRRDGRDFLFGYGRGGFSGWSDAKENLDDAVKIPHWTLHDLRRTVATRMADIGVRPHVIEAILNHISGHKAGVAGIYNRSTYAAEKKAALDLWANHLAVAIAKASGANVTSLQDRATKVRDSASQAG
jgi:integrase